MIVSKLTFCICIKARHHLMIFLILFLCCFRCLPNAAENKYFSEVTVHFTSTTSIENDCLRSANDGNASRPNYLLCYRDYLWGFHNAWPLIHGPIQANTYCTTRAPWIRDSFTYIRPWKKKSINRSKIFTWKWLFDFLHIH